MDNNFITGKLRNLKAMGIVKRDKANCRDLRGADNMTIKTHLAIHAKNERIRFSITDASVVVAI